MTTRGAVEPLRAKRAKDRRDGKSAPSGVHQSLKDIKAAAQSAATSRSYGIALRHFKRHRGKIPATADVVCRYLVQFAGVLSVATLQHRLVAIHRAHVDHGFASPVMNAEVKKTMQGIRRTYGTAQRRVKALVKDDLIELLALVDKQRPTKASRDRALLLVGFAGAFRRSELVALRVEDVTYFESGMELLLRRSKTDQEGAGRTVFIPAAKGLRCPVKALRDWLQQAEIGEGPIFRSVSRHDCVARERPLSAQSVALIVKEAVGRLRGADSARHVAAHSLRAGFVTEAAMVGLQPYQIREVTGHRSDTTLAKYIRPVNKRKVPSLL